MLRRIINIIRSLWGWSFTASSLKRSRLVVTEGEEIVFSGDVKNEGLRIGTAYVRVLVADSYHLDNPLFDSDRDLAPNVRQAMRLLDINVGDSRRFACAWLIPSGTSHRHFDMRLQIWNPHLLFGGPYPYRFFDTGWLGGFEVVSKGTPVLRPKVFISYSWDSEEHKDWVRQLVEELHKHDIDSVIDQKDLFAGDETTRFMEHEITQAKIRILICTENYTKKANSRDPGGVGFETIITSHEYLLCLPEDRKRFIPVVRNNNLPKGRKLPTYLGSTLYIDMNGDNWRAEPMLDLVTSIKRHS